MTSGCTLSNLIKYSNFGPGKAATALAATISNCARVFPTHPLPTPSQLLPNPFPGEWKSRERRATGRVFTWGVCGCWCPTLQRSFANVWLRGAVWKARRIGRRPEKGGGESGGGGDLKGLQWKRRHGANGEIAANAAADRLNASLFRG